MPALTLAAWGDKLQASERPSSIVPKRGLWFAIAAVVAVACAVIIVVRGLNVRGADCALLWAALAAVGVIAVGFGIYRRSWQMPVAMLVAAALATAVPVAVVALLGWQLYPAALAAVGAVALYSLYDSMVTFDRIREQVADLTAARDASNYAARVNLALTRILPRSAGVVIVPVLFSIPFLFVGRDFRNTALVLIVGLIAAAAATVFVAVLLEVTLRGGAAKAAAKR